MRPALVLRAKHAYQPMIQFLGQRKNLPKAPHAPAPHPAAPDSVKADFQSFLSKLQSQSGGADSPSSNPKGQSLESSARGEVLPGGSGGGSSSSQGVSDKTQGPIASKPADYDNFWEAPGYLWQLPEVGDREAEAILLNPMRIQGV